jgi:hypothetical protein
MTRRVGATSPSFTSGGGPDPTPEATAVERTAQELADAERACEAARAARMPLERAWGAGLPEPDAPPLPPLAPGHFRMPAGVWPSLTAARRREREAEARRREALAAHTAASRPAVAEQRG